MAIKNNFGVYDYLVLSSVLSISIIIGLYHAIKFNFKKYFKFCIKKVNDLNKTESESEKNDKIKEYLLAGKNMSALPVALSLLASFFSATSLLGFPAEVYQFGIQYWISIIGLSIPPFIGAFLTGPMFARLKVLSVFEYFKLRYDSSFVRLLAVCCYSIKILLSTSIFIYGPSTALKTLTNMSTIASVIVVGSVTTFYTTIGGMKAVIWTDVFQIIIMFSGMIAIIIKGTYDVGGISELWRINAENGRLNFFDFDPNPLIRQSFWTLVFPPAIHSLATYSLEQQMVQRFACAKDIRTAQFALLLNVPLQFFLFSFCFFAGLVLYANYYNCDPLSKPNQTGVQSSNQLMTYFVMDKLYVLKGLSGLFISAILSASLSSISSSLNGIATIIWQDFLKRFRFFRELNDSKSTLTVKLLVLLFGCVCTLLAILISGLGGNLVQVSTTLNGSFNGPIIGLFILGCLFPFTNKYGASVGAVCGFIMGIWVSFGAFVMSPNYPKLNVSVECYNINNNTFQNQTVTTIESLVYINSLNTSESFVRSKEASNLYGFNRFYSLSYQLFNTIAVVTTVLSGIIISLLTGCYKNNLDESLLLFKGLKKCKINWKKTSKSISNNIENDENL